MCLAVPGQVLSIEGEDELTRQGRVAFGGIVRAAGDNRIVSGGSHCVLYPGAR